MVKVPAGMSANIVKLAVNLCIYVLFVTERGISIVTIELLFGAINPSSLIVFENNNSVNVTLSLILIYCYQNIIY